ncbi:MAG: hypothetical protein LW823_02475 [Rickettsiales bacterium]|jgi:cobaltochelatase CobT|nr:hypothetical protein [Rickettsiales bacterium]
MAAESERLTHLRQELLAASRALAAEKKEFSLPPLAKPPSDDELPLVRAMMDEQAIRHRYHNASLHQQLRPNQLAQAALFDTLEAVRMEAIGSRYLSGVQFNLLKKFERAWQMKTIASQTMTPQAATELLARVDIAGQDISGAGVDEAREKLSDIAPHLKQLSNLTSTQEAYAKEALKLLETLALIKASNEDKNEGAGPPPAPDDHANTNDAQSKVESGMSSPTSPDGMQEPSLFPVLSSVPAEASESPPPGKEEAGDNPFPHTHNQTKSSLAPYHAYTKRYDEVIAASQLASLQELEQLREQLDARLEQFQSLTARLANKLQRLLLARQARHWMFDQDDGIIDNRKLTRLIIHPEEEQIYKREHDTDFRDTVVTLLIDNSGSMRGRPITMAALSADLMARTLERCGVKTEILGFTTKEWKGGASYKEWLKAGKPAQAGRLNDLRHIIYKPADISWRKAKKNLGLMLKDGILKENIDGEAILWAAERLLSRPEQRRILMVISDGAPVDDSTLSANTGNYLDRHLRDVIELVETKMPIELLAIGIGHDVTRYYKHAVTISEIEKLGEAMTEQLTGLFKADRKTKRRLS